MHCKIILDITKAIFNISPNVNELATLESVGGCPTHGGQVLDT